MPDPIALPPAWRPIVKRAVPAAVLSELADFLAREEAGGRTIHPPAPLRFRALELTPPDAVRVVILGQDPYHGPGQAHGLAFSVPPGVRVPPSLANIYKELARDLGIARAAHGCLEHWARQGVLLLNTVLTVEAGRAASHQRRGWEQVTDAIVAHLAGDGTPRVFLLWGGHAQRKADAIPALADPHHLVLRAPHPSPLSAHTGFIGCGHFSQTDAFLAAHGTPAIDWSLTGRCDGA